MSDGTNKEGNEARERLRERATDTTSTLARFGQTRKDLTEEAILESPKISIGLPESRSVGAGGQAGRVTSQAETPNCLGLNMFSPDLSSVHSAAFASEYHLSDRNLRLASPPMLKVPPAAETQFETPLEDRAIAPRERGGCRKRLRYHPELRHKGSFSHVRREGASNRSSSSGQAFRHA